jgi:hypothetical protein
MVCLVHLWGMLSSSMLLLNLILLIDVTFSTPRPFTPATEDDFDLLQNITLP